MIQVKVIGHEFTDTNLEGKKCPGGVIITTAEMEINNEVITIDFEDIGIRKDGELVFGEYDAENMLFTPKEIIERRNAKKPSREPMEVFRMVLTAIVAIVVITLIVFMCMGKMFAYHIFLGLIVLALIVSGIVLITLGFRKKDKIKSENTVEVEGVITSFLETHQLEKADTIMNSREIKRNEDVKREPYGVIVQRNSMGMRARKPIRYFTPYYTYEYEGVIHNRPSIQKWRYEALKREKLYIGKQVKILINPEDKTIYVPIEKTNSVYTVMGAIFTFVGLVMGAAFIFWII